MRKWYASYSARIHASGDDNDSVRDIFRQICSRVGEVVLFWGGSVAFRVPPGRNNVLIRQRGPSWRSPALLGGANARYQVLESSLPLQRFSVPALLMFLPHLRLATPPKIV